MGKTIIVRDPVTRTVVVNRGPPGPDGPSGPPSSGGLLPVNNLSDLTNANTARANLGVAIGSQVQAYSAILGATTAAFETADQTKLDGIADGATANASNAALRDRATHTGSQAIATVTGLQTALDDKLDDGQATAAGLALLGAATAAAQRTALNVAVALSGNGLITVPVAALEYRETIAAAGVTAASVVSIGLGAVLDGDENDPELFARVNLWGVPGIDVIDVFASFSLPASGPIKINWRA